MKFHSLRNNLNNNSQKKESFNIKELISKLDIMFEEKLSQSFKNILIFPKNQFLDLIISQVKNFLDEQFGDEIYKNEKFINFFSSSCNNLEDKYNTYLEELNQMWEEYNSKKYNSNDNSFYFSKFRKHCIKTDNFAMHKCSDNEIGCYIISSKKLKRGIRGQSSFQYLICNKCKSVFFTNKFINYCKDCKENYLSSALNHNEDPDLLLATWKNPHCDTLVNEKIKCTKCKYNFLYLNMKSNRLQCKNKSCNYNEIPYNIEWNCYLCNNTFYSNVKVYNPIEVQEIKDIIKLTLLLKKKAHPTSISCCKDIDVETQDFFHKKECKGLLYFGEYNTKIIIVCEKCKAINFLVKFIWTCPLCGIRFKDKSIKKNNINNDEIKQNNLSYKSRKNKNFEKNNEDDKENKGNNKTKNDKSYGRRNKETLISLLRKRNELSHEKDDDKKINDNEYSNKFNRKRIENDSKTFNIKSIKYDDNIDNINSSSNTLKIIQLDFMDDHKNLNYNSHNRREYKKSSSESKSIKNFSKRNSYYEKRISEIEPIKEENDIKNSSPQKKIQNNNINNVKTEDLTNQSEASKQQNNRIYFKDEENKRDNRFSPRIKNSIYNKYLNYINVNQTSNNKKDINNDKLINNYQRKKNDEENKNENHNNINKSNNVIIYKNNNHNYNYYVDKKTNKENLNNYIENEYSKNNDKICVNKKECKIFPINEKYSYYKKSNENNNDLLTNKNNVTITNYNTYKNSINKNSINSYTFLLNKSYKKKSIQENNSNQEELRKKYYETKLLSKENKIETKEVKEFNNENKNQINNNKLRTRNYNNYEGNKEENDTKDKIRSFRLRSRLKYKTREQEEKTELKENNIGNDQVKIEDNNKGNNLHLSMNNYRITKKDSLREKLKTFDLKREEEINKKRNERRQVKSRKEILKEKEKNNNLNFLSDKKEKESINNLEIRENKRYSQNTFFDTHQESSKTKENTLSHYTKDSYVSKDNNQIHINNISSEVNNILRYKNTSYNFVGYNKEKVENMKSSLIENQKSKENESNTEVKTYYRTKKSRKDYINERIKKNNENLMSDKKNENKVFIPNKKDYLLRTSYQPNKKCNIIMDNIDVNIEKEEDIPIFDKEIRKDKAKYNQLQYQLKTILVKSCLPKFNIDYYIIKNQIGTGSFGIIFQVYNIKSRCKFALKKIFAPDISTLQKFVKEFELLHQNPHEHILDIIGVCIQCIDITNYVLYVLMDLAEKDWNNEINYRVGIKKYYFENELINILKQLNSALYFLQKDKKISHRDIKPENILIFKNDVYKIGDFGEAKENKIQKQFSTLRGTELYMSPLLYNGLQEKKEDIKHNQFKSDMFSLGLCFIYAASLNLNIIVKIREVNNKVSLKKILMNEFDRRYSEKFVDLIMKMIDFNEDKRIDFIQLDKILREEF